MADPIHIQAPDGSIVQFPDGTSDDTIKSVMAKNYPAPEAPASLSISDHIHNFRQSLHEATRQLENSFLMGLGDRANAGMGAIIGDGTYGGNLKDEQAQTAKFAEDNPVAAPVIGGIGAMAAPVGAIGAASKATTLGGKTLAGLGAGGAIGAFQGAASSPDWTNLPQTGRDAATGGAINAAIGGVIPGAAKIIGAGFNAGANMLRGNAADMSRGASRHLTEALAADTPQAVQGKLGELGPGAMLADSGPAMLGKAQGASLNSDEGRSILQGALTARNEGTNQRIMGDVNRALGPAEDPQTVTNAIREHRSDVDAQSYPAAFANAPPVDTSNVLARLGPMIGQSEGMERRALTNLRDSLMVDQNGQVAPQTNAINLHKIKGEIDNVIQYDAPGLGVPAAALSRQQGALRQMRGELNAALENQVPGYREANAQSAALARRGEAVDQGTQYLGSGKTTPSPDRFAAEFAQREPGEQIAFAKGSRGNIERVLGTTANNLQALRSELQGEGGWNTAKIGTVHGQQAADDLIGSVDRNLKFRDTYNKVVENSQTAQRTAAANAMKPTPATETPLINPNMNVTGLLATALKKGAIGTVNALARTDPTRSFGEIAKVMTATGQARDKHLQALINALEKRKGHAAMSEAVGNQAALAAALLGNGYANNRMKTQR